MSRNLRSSNVHRIMSPESDDPPESSSNVHSDAHVKVEVIAGPSNPVVPAQSLAGQAQGAVVVTAIEVDDDLPRPRVDELWTDESAGFVLVSADDLRFHVPVYHLQAASPILRDKVKDQSELKLTQPGLEDSSVISIVLHALTHGDPHVAIRKFGTDSFCQDLMWAYRFATVYACLSVQSTIKSWLKEYLVSADLSPLDVFVIACKENMREIAGAALRQSFNPRKTTLMRRAQVFGTVGGDGRLDPKYLDRRAWKELTGEYLHALWKVSKKTKMRKEKKETDLDGPMAEKMFLMILNENDELR